MDPDVKPAAYEGIVKLDFKLKTKPKDGVILQLHNTIRNSKGEAKRIRFISAAFNDLNERLSCGDLSGNIFILDFCNLKFWKLMEIGACSAMHFVPEKLYTLVVAMSQQNYEVCFIDIESGVVSAKLLGHTAPVKDISFSTKKNCNLLTASSCEAIIWELRDYTKYFTLNTYKDAHIQQILFTPVCDNLVACFQNDTVQVWKQDTLKSVKQIIPSELKHMKSIAFTMNGRAMVMAGLSPNIILFSLDTWKAIRSIDLSKYDIHGVKQICFIPQVFDGGSNKILAILSSQNLLYIFDLEISSVIFTICPVGSSIKKFIISPSGKYLVCILQMGEANIYNTSHIMDMATRSKGDNFQNRDDKNSIGEGKKCSKQEESDEEFSKDDKRDICLDNSRLRRIISIYGEYPERYRPIIWRALLDTPCSKNAYVSLVSKPIHLCYKDLEKQFTIHSSATLKNLKRLLSCLAHWCDLFGVMKFLPGFVFPFVKVLHKEPLLLFECVTSILINYCQLWFEYAPFPPINILAIIENVLAEHDSNLLEHFCKVGVTSQVYVLKILETAFSEVLSSSEWLVLWDHILSSEPSFFLLAVVAYNIIQRNALKKFKRLDQFESYYHAQNPLDMKNFLKKCYTLLNETSEEVHPRQYLNNFTPMEKGSCYPQFTGYPKATVSLKLSQYERKNVPKVKKADSLKFLTQKCQKRELSNRLQSKNHSVVISEAEEEDNESFESNEEFSDDNPVTELGPMKQVDQMDSKLEDFTKIFGTDDIEIMSSTNEANLPEASEVSSSSHDKVVKKDDCFTRNKTDSRVRYCGSRKKNDNLEREVEKLLFQFSEAEK